MNLLRYVIKPERAAWTAKVEKRVGGLVKYEKRVVSN